MFEEITVASTFRRFFLKNGVVVAAGEFHNDSDNDNDGEYVFPENKLDDALFILYSA